MACNGIYFSTGLDRAIRLGSRFGDRPLKRTPPVFDPLECPPLIHSSEALMARSRRFLADTACPPEVAEGLLKDLHQHAMSLGYSKAYESSPDIYWLLQSAAVVALLAFGSGSEIFRRKRAEVAYYGAFAETRERVRAFEDFVAQWAL